MVVIRDTEALRLFGQRVRQIRLDKGLTQEALEFKSGVTLSQINRIELGKVNPTINTVFALARTLQVELKDLFDFDLPPISEQER